jgi:hypothetical protein
MLRAVDYSAHICHKFMTSGGTKRSRSALALAVRAGLLARLLAGWQACALYSAAHPGVDGVGNHAIHD